MRKENKQDKLVKVFFSIVFLIYSYCTRLKILPYNEAIDKIENRDGGVYIEFSDKVDKIDINKINEPIEEVDSPFMLFYLL